MMREKYFIDIGQFPQIIESFYFTFIELCEIEFEIHPKKD